MKSALYLGSSIFIHGLIALLIYLIFYQFSNKSNDNINFVDLIDNSTPIKSEKTPAKIFDQNTPRRKIPEKITGKDQLSPTTKNDPQNKQQKQQQSTAQNEFNSKQQEDLNFQKDTPEMDPEAFVPEKIQKQLPENKPLNTKYSSLNYGLSNYDWSFQTYVEQWARKLIDWWGPPADYLAGNYPLGGSVWVSAKINKKGQLLSFEINKSKVSSEMENKAIQALISSFELPKLPADYPDVVTFHWQFIYPKYGPDFDPKKRR